MAYPRDPSGSFTVTLFESDFNAIKNWVLQYPNKETGGDLFGLWRDESNAVIHVVLGPGKRCYHGKYSYRQVGDTLTKDYMLEHIGEWHSNHHLSLDEPSQGDCITIERNFPQGSKNGFILMIAYIITKEDVQVAPYLFYQDSVSFKRGHVEILFGRTSPFRFASKISSQIEEGMEPPKYLSKQPASPVAYPREPSFTVTLFESDLNAIQNWVLQYPNKETGGDLFGLWRDETNAVIHVVLGPGKGCKHGEYSFYQDVSYLDRIGGLLTKDYMLAHIGEWHSHHHLSLDKPSEGDCSTIEENFPQGSNGFILMIANIITKEDVQVAPYLFHQDSTTYQHGHVKVLFEQTSPFRFASKISSQIEKGMEPPKSTVEPFEEMYKQIVTFV